MVTATAGLGALVALAGCAPGSIDRVPAAGDPADVVYLGGDVLTMDPELPRADALATTGGRIVAIGDTADIEALVGPDTRVVELDGSTLLPGFVDSHTHFFGAGVDDPAATQEQILSYGVTTIGELGVSPELHDHIQALAANGDLRVRVSEYLAALNSCGEHLGDWFVDVVPPHKGQVGEGEAATGEPAEPGTGGADEPGALVEIPGVKLFTDGGSCGIPAGTTASGEPFGDLWLSDEQLAAYITEYDALGYQVAVHVLGVRAIDQTLRVYTDLFGGESPAHHRIEHNALVTPDFAGRYDAAGVVGTIFGAYPACTFEDLLANGSSTLDLDKEWNWRRLLDENPGTVFAWSSDAGVPALPDPSTISALAGFVTRTEVTADGRECTPTPEGAAGAIGVQEALELMTTGGAYALDREDEIGMLRVGMLADLTVLSENPRTVPPERLRDLHVELTVVGGDEAFCRGDRARLCGA